MADAPSQTTPQSSANQEQPPADGNTGGTDVAAHGQAAAVIVRGEAVTSAQSSHHNPKDTKPDPVDELSEDKVKARTRLPALDDDAAIRVQKQQVVTRDGKADLAFTGTLLASAAPDAAPEGEWQENRIYETDSGNYVFSKVTRNIKLKEDDSHEAEVFEPTPSSTTSKILRSATDLARSHPLTWQDAAVKFFGYDPLAKVLYRKLGGEFEQHIS